MASLRDILDRKQAPEPDGQPQPVPQPVQQPQSQPVSQPQAPVQAQQPVQPVSQPRPVSPLMFVADHALSPEFRQFLEREYTVIVWSERVFTNRDIAYFERLPETVLYIDISAQPQRHWLELQQYASWRVITLVKSSRSSDWVDAFAEASSVTLRTLSRLLRNVNTVPELLAAIDTAIKIEYIGCVPKLVRAVLKLL